MEVATARSTSCQSSVKTSKSRAPLSFATVVVVRVDPQTETSIVIESRVDLSEKASTCLLMTKPVVDGSPPRRHPLVPHQDTRATSDRAETRMTPHICPRMFTRPLCSGGLRPHNAHDNGWFCNAMQGTTKHTTGVQGCASKKPSAGRAGWVQKGADAGAGSVLRVDPENAKHKTTNTARTNHTRARPADRLRSAR